MRLVRAIAAAAALVAILVGIPALLLHTIGNPLQVWPDLTAGDVNDRVVYSLLAAVAWVAWAQFLLAVLVESLSGVRRTPVPRRIPGVFAFQQLSARALVTALLMLAPAVLAAVTPTAVAVAAATHAAPAAVTATTPTTVPHRTPPTGTDRAAPNQPAGRTVTVEITPGGPHTWWDLAEQHLGSGQRWSELWHLNQGRPEPGGVRLTTPGVLKDGWTLLIPAPAADRTPATAPTHRAQELAAAVAAAPPITEHLAKQHQHLAVVKQGDSLARIATQHGTNWVQLWHANQNRPEPGGATLSDPDYLEPGWTIDIPAPPAATTGHNTITVHAGDTLSQIAADHHTTTTALWAANAGRDEPAGAFTDPDLLEPGWHLTIPNTPPAHQPASTPGHSQAAAHHADSHENTAQARTANAAAARAAAARAAERRQAAHDRAAIARQETANRANKARVAEQQRAADAAKAAVEAEHVKASPSPSAPTTAPTSTAPANASATPSSTAPSHPDRLPAGPSSNGQMLMVAGGGAVLLAGVSLTVLLRHRRSQFRRRRPGRVIVEPPAPLHRVERTLVTVGGPAMSDVDRLDRALRGLAQMLSGSEGGRLPDVIAVRMTRDQIELVLAAPMTEPVLPWTVGDTGLRWTLHRDDPDGYDPDGREYHYAPYPALVSIGHTPDGDLWLIDLERVGSLGLSGPAERCLNLARFVAAELAHNVWSDLLQVTLVGFGDELADLNPDRLICTDNLDTAVADLRHQHTRATHMMATAGVDVATGRLRNIAGDVWPPQILLLAPNLDQSDHLDDVLRAVAATDRSAVAVVLTRVPHGEPEAQNDNPGEDLGEHPSVRWRISIDDTGTLTIPALGVQVVAEQLPAAEAADLAQLMAVVCTAEDRPAPLARGIQRWDEDEHEDADADGGGAPPPEPDPLAPPVVRLAATNPDRTNSLLPLPTAIYLERAATTAADIETLAPAADPIPHDVRGDRTLDDDIAAWNDPNDPTPKISLLGPITVRAAGQLNPQRPRKAFNTEVIAYLAARPRGATIEQFATDMWPDDPNPAAKPKARNAFYTARQWLGKNPPPETTTSPPKPPSPAPNTASKTSSSTPNCSAASTPAPKPAAPKASPTYKPPSTSSPAHRSTNADPAATPGSPTPPSTTNTPP